MEDNAEVFNAIVGIAIERYLTNKLTNYIKIVYPQYEILKEECLEEGLFMLINNKISEKIIGIIPTNSNSIYGNSLEAENIEQLRNIDFNGLYEIKNFTDDKL